MRSVLIIKILLGIAIWQWLAGGYSFGQVTEQSPLVGTVANANPSELPLSIYILYFDQSSSVLRSGVKATLETVARQLAGQPAWVATVTGYTDDIGKRELNMVLAEQRAKTVAAFLKQHRVHTDQIKVNWEGPDKTASTENREAIKTISRRVVVQLSPR